jgi:osmotically inducible lipoprotein OsmB
MIMWRAIATYVVLVPVGLSLAGCGYNPGDRALSGGLIGAGGGALGGALTSGHDINLGRPIWR